MAKTTDIVKKIEKSKDVIIELKQIADMLSKKDIAKWRSAWQMALNIENPKRYDLYQIYRDNLADLHLKAAIRNRKLKALSKNFKITKDGEEVPELTVLLKTKWFKSFLNLSLDSVFYGHSLIQFGDVTMDGDKLKFDGVKLVPRTHVCPEYGVLLREPSDDPKNGIDYKKAFSDWVIEVGDSEDLGLLNEVSHQTIAKRHALAFWDQFAEIFGMPIRIGKTTSRDKKEIDRIDAMMANMGAASYGVFPTGTEIEVIEGSKGDAFNVYDKRIERANSEMSKHIQGQTMTMDNGSSRSQAEVHLSVSEDIMWADADLLKDVINDLLIPFMNKHAFGFEGCLFEWDETYEFTQTEMTEVETLLLEYYDIDPVYFIEKYNIPITGKKETPIPPTGKTPEKKKLSLSANIELLYSACPNCGGTHTSIQLSKKDAVNMDAEASRIAKAIFDGKLQQGDVDTRLLKLVAEKLKKGLTDGYELDINTAAAASPDELMIQNLKDNIYQFSTAKNYQQLMELTGLLHDAQGNIRPFNDFKADVIAKNRVYNVSWLQTEYDTAVNGSSLASRWVQFQANKEAMPDLIYQTAGDKRVRASHRSLDGTQQPIDSDFWKTYYPPNGFNCRCTVNQTGNGKATNMDKVKYPAVPDLFKTNLAQSGLIFPKDHPYFDGVPDDVLKTYTEKLKNG